MQNVLGKIVLLFVVGTLFSGCQKASTPEPTASNSSTPVQPNSGHLSLAPFSILMEMLIEGSWEESIKINSSGDGRVTVEILHESAPEFLQLSSDGKLQMGGHPTVFELTPEGVVLENGKSSGYRFQQDDTLLYEEEPALAREGETIKDMSVDDGRFFFQEAFMRVTMEGETSATRQAIFALNSYMRAVSTPTEPAETVNVSKDEATLESIATPKDEATLEDIGDEFRY